MMHGHFPASYQVNTTHADELPMNLIGTAFWVTVAYLMYRSKVFIKI